MTREEAAQILHPDTSLKAICTHRPVEEIYSIIKEAELMGAEALRSPWVKTSDRLPEERDGDHVLVATYDADRRQWIWWVTSRGLVKSCPQIEWWTPIPTLPEAAK